MVKVHGNITHTHTHTHTRDFLGNLRYQGQDAIFGAVYAHKGRTKKLQRHGLHRFALDQPSINGIGPINRQKNGNGRKRSETVGNGRKRSEI